MSTLGAATPTNTSAQITLASTSMMRITELKSHLRGFYITDNAKENIRASIRRAPIVFPSQEVKEYDGNNGPTGGGIISQWTIPLFNTNSILLAFPKTSNQLTVFENPIQDGAQLKIDNKFIPSEAYSTTGTIHRRDQITLAELDENINPSKEFTDSIGLSKNKNDGTRYANSLRDDTSYTPQFQTERLDGSYVVDGLNSKGNNWSIEYRAVPQFRGINDTYLRPDNDNTSAINNERPKLYECRDTFFVLHEQGGVFSLRYFGDKTPRGSQEDPENYAPGEV
jgi:hypothetical protein